ncbi:hypothetical protein BpHYR1_049618 [Brachionus plicatilis]|uniref:Uncharacterized protein n=1 Tax=Brachionus plicatilis TaxID=10195 RepID=A0A3M7RMP2_BRAPC|nr:hypothetical protein BpHYR1_049618 [Brachionus plicatilis]
MASEQMKDEVISAIRMEHFGKRSNTRASAKHPQTYGKAEIFIRFLKNALATVISSDQSDWHELIEDCLLAYRMTIISTIQ